MSTKLRTSAPINPRNKGDRIRYARINAGLSQDQLGRGVSQATGNKVTKGLVSQWESGHVQNPTNDNLMAIQTITGFSAQWIVNGKGQERVSVGGKGKPGGDLIDVKRLEQALKAALPDDLQAPEIARAAASLYDMLGDTPDIEPSLLTRFAQTLLRR